jgi:hypothetical protein
MVCEDACLFIPVWKYMGWGCLKSYQNLGWLDRPKEKKESSDRNADEQITETNEHSRDSLRQNRHQHRRHQPNTAAATETTTTTKTTKTTTNSASAAGRQKASRTAAYKPTTTNMKFLPPSFSGKDGSCVNKVNKVWRGATHNTQHTTHNTQHTTHNTQHTTHNTQHTMHNTQCIHNT